mmetsp:Transcript_15648/g.63029  ORF Transcript_15648/g.63029 Transcript_15648/m.63029 type:complete len:212 (-) Transcript_15648:1740-2375(-)
MTTRRWLWGGPNFRTTTTRNRRAAHHTTSRRRRTTTSATVQEHDRGSRTSGSGARTTRIIAPREHWRFRSSGRGSPRGGTRTPVSWRSSRPARGTWSSTCTPTSRADSTRSARSSSGSTTPCRTPRCAASSRTASRRSTRGRTPPTPTTRCPGKISCTPASSSFSTTRRRTIRPGPKGSRATAARASRRPRRGSPSTRPRCPPGPRTAPSW